MNKRPVVNSRRSTLEAELTAEITEQQSDMMDTGKDRVGDPYSKNLNRKYNKFNIQQGHRRRHPQRVLNQHAGISTSTEHAESVWEQALLHDHERTNIPEEYKPEGHDQMATQLGLYEISNKNFNAAKNKMQSISTVVGV